MRPKPRGKFVIVRCGTKDHKIEKLPSGSIRIVDHDKAEIEANLAAVALGGTPCRCVEIWSAFQKRNEAPAWKKRVKVRLVAARTKKTFKKKARKRTSPKSNTWQFDVPKALRAHAGQGTNVSFYAPAGLHLNWNYAKRCHAYTVALYRLLYLPYCGKVSAQVSTPRPDAYVGFSLKEATKAARQMGRKLGKPYSAYMFDRRRGMSTATARMMIKKHVIGVKS